MAYSNTALPPLPDGLVSGYSYNGVELPDINEVWTDKETYPYAYICLNKQSTEYLLYLSKAPAIYYSSRVFGGHTYRNTLLVVSGNIIQYIAKIGSSSWSYKNSWTPSSSSQSLFGYESVSGYDMSYSVTWVSADVSNASGDIIYSNSEPVPVLAYPYSVMVYDYEKGAEDWYQVHLYYSATPFTWNGDAVINSGTVYKRIYDAAYDGWTEEAETEIEASPGLTGTTYQRIYTDHDIKDSAGNIWLAAGSVTEAEEIVTEKWLRSFQAGLALGLTGNAQYMLSTPSYIWDEESGSLTVIQDDGSLGFLFDQDTFHMKVTQKQ